MKIFAVSAWFFTIVTRYDPFLSLQSTPDVEHITIWTSLRSAKNVKKQQEVSDLNRD